MLSEAERHEIEEELAHVARRASACIEALKAVQRHRGWISDDSLRDIAEFLGMSVEELDSVATFYNLIYRKPVGRHVIHVCDSVTCWIMGYERLYEHFRKRLGIAPGQTSADGRFTLLPVPCLGVCERAPALMIDGDVHLDIAPEKLDTILEQYR